jgi:hypothetical protein
MGQPPPAEPERTAEHERVPESRMRRTLADLTSPQSGRVPVQDGCRSRNAVERNSGVRTMGAIRQLHASPLCSWARQDARLFACTVEL